MIFRIKKGKPSVLTHRNSIVGELSIPIKGIIILLVVSPCFETKTWFIVSYFPIVSHFVLLVKPIHRGIYDDLPMKHGDFFHVAMLLPIGSMYAIYGNIDHQYTPNVSIYTIHGSYVLKKEPRVNPHDFPKETNGSLALAADQGLGDGPGGSGAGKIRASGGGWSYICFFFWIHIYIYIYIYI